MSDVWLNIVMVVVFVLIGGFFSGTELALISLRESQVRALSEQGRRGTALQQAPGRPQPVPRHRADRRHPGHALGVRLRCGDPEQAVHAALVGWGLSPGLAGPLAFIAVTVAVSYLSLVLGELTPKRLALQRAEGLAMFVAPLAQPVGHPVPADRLAAVGLHERAGPAARRRPEGQRRGDQPGGAA